MLCMQRLERAVVWPLSLEDSLKSGSLGPDTKWLVAFSGMVLTLSFLFT